MLAPITKFIKSMSIPSLEHHTSNWRKYLIAGVVALLLFVGLSAYIFLRRGYFDFYIANKVFAGVAFLLIAIVLLIGPLTRLYQVFDGWMMYRKELGVLAFLLALLHSVISLFLLPDHFPFAYFINNAFTTILGILAVIVLAFLFTISRQKILSRIDHHFWWKMQFWGIRIAGTLIFFHVFLLKWSGWIQWYVKGGSSDLLRPYLPGASLIIAPFGLFVLGVRIVELAMPIKITRIAVPILLGVYILWLGITAMWHIN